VREVRLIHRLQPRFNRQAKSWSSYAYLKLTAERFPRLSVVRTVKDDGALYLGPLPSARSAKRVAEAIHTALPIRRCTGVAGSRSAPCAAAQLGVALCPCDGGVSEEAYAAVVARLRLGLEVDPRILLDPLVRRMDALAADERFEEAADMRDRAAALSQALRRQRRFDALRRAGRVVVEVPGRGGAELVHGRLVRSWAEGQPSLPWGDDDDAGPPGLDDLTRPPDRSLADELVCVASWLDRESARVRLVHADEGLASAYPVLPSFEPARPRPMAAPQRGPVVASRR